ncbi:hypothetical protein [Streptomyces sp. NPDC004232]
MASIRLRPSAGCPHTEAKAGYEALARFDLNHFGNAWGNLLAQVA